MKITCLITVCAYLLSTVSTDEIQYSNRLKRIRSEEDSVVDHATARKELNSNTGIHSDVFSMSRNSRPKGQIETFQKPFQKKVYKSPARPQQHPRSKHPPKRLKIRSIAGSTYEIDDNEVHEIHEIHESIPEVHNEGPIYIKPVFRVIKNKNVLDSIVDIMRQLLVPSNNHLGPIVGPIQMPGSKRKIYLRLLEPVDSSHINVRFVTQVPVPVVDEDSLGLGSLLPFLPFDPGNTLLHRYPVESSDATFSSSNRHNSIQLPRNASHISGKGRKLQPKPATKSKSPSQNLKETDNENSSPVKVEAASGAESDKNHLYYQYQSGDDDIKQVTLKDTTENEKGSKDSLEPWYQLSTHRLPLRQIAPLYPLSVMEHTDSSSNTYNVPSDSLTVPSPHSNSYEQYDSSYSNTAAVNAAPGYYDQSYTIPNTYSTTYQKQNEFSNAPSSYLISYQNQNEFNNAPSSTSSIKQNDLFNDLTSYTSSYAKPTHVPPSSNSYAASHEAQIGSSSQNALHVIDPPSYFLDPQKPLENHTNKVFEHTTIPQQYYNLPNSQQYYNLPNSQQYYNLLNVNEIGTLPSNAAQNGVSPIDQVTWGKVKREKSESNFQKSAKITSDDNREKWQPFVPENIDWQKAFANLAKNGEHHETVIRQQSVNRPRQASRNTTPSTIERRINQRQSDKRRNHPVATTQSSRCLTSDKGDRCERMESIASTPYPEMIIRILEEQTQSAANIEPIAVITPKSVAKSTKEVETSRLNVITKSSWIEEPQPLVMTTESLVTNGTTERPPLLIKVMKTEKSIENKTTSGSMMSNLTEKSVASSTTERSSIGGTSEASIPNSTTKRLIKVIKSRTEKSIENKKTTSGSMMSNLIEKSVASSTTERSSIGGTSETSIPNNTTKRLQFPKRPIIMKKSTFVLKRFEPSSTTRRTVTSSTTRKSKMGTTEKTKATRQSKIRGAVSKTKLTIT